MAQFMIHHDVVDSPFLRGYIREIVEEFEHLLPENSPLTVHIKRTSRRLFCADIRAKLFGRPIVVSAVDTDLFLALARARRHLLRQMEDSKGLRTDRIRHRRSRSAFKSA